jgi:hypothetical protein
MEVRGKVAIVTGAGSGIGRAAAPRLAPCRSRGRVGRSPCRRSGGSEWAAPGGAGGGAGGYGGPGRDGSRGSSARGRAGAAGCGLGAPPLAQGLRRGDRAMPVLHSASSQRERTLSRAARRVAHARTGSPSSSRSPAHPASAAASSHTTAGALRPPGHHPAPTSPRLLVRCARPPPAPSGVPARSNMNASHKLSPNHALACLKSSLRSPIRPSAGPSRRWRRSAGGGGP